MSVIRVLLPAETGDDDTRVLTDGLESIPAIIDHEREVSSKPLTGFGEGTRAVVIHRIRASCGPGTDIAVLAHVVGEGNIALSVKGLRTDLGERPHDGGDRGSNNEPSGCISEGALQAIHRASLVLGAGCGCHAQNKGGDCGDRESLRDPDDVHNETSIRLIEIRGQFQSGHLTRIRKRGRKVTGVGGGRHKIRCKSDRNASLSSVRSGCGP